MKTLILCMCVSLSAFAQTPINKVVPVQSGQKIVMHFDYPELVKITTWDRNEISVKGSVSINAGENDDAFQLLTSVSGNTVTIKNEIRDMENLPRLITVMDGTQKIVFRNKAELKKYKDENKGNYDRVSYGLDMDIFLEIKVPQNFDTYVESVYGMVEVENFKGPLTVDATYGGVDAALIETAISEITAETNHGEIYSNLEAKFSGEASGQRNFHTVVRAKLGNGPRYNFDSEYGNVYLRKANK